MRDLQENDFLYIIEKMNPRVRSALKQTNIKFREDLEQDIMELIFRLIKEEKISKNVDGFFAHINKLVKKEKREEESYQEILDKVYKVYILNTNYLQ